MHIQSPFLSTFTTLLLLTFTVTAQDLPTNTIFQNVQAFNQTEDIGHNTYHISVVNEYAPLYLQELLSGPGPVTFFAPSDHSFDRLKQNDPAFLEKFRADPALIKATLQYHVLNQIYDIKTAPERSLLPSILSPGTIDATILPNDPAKHPPFWIPCILKGSGNPTISATIVHTMRSSNGILYVIDTMLVPGPEVVDASNKTPKPTLAITTTASVQVSTTRGYPSAVTGASAGASAGASVGATPTPVAGAAAAGNKGPNSAATSAGNSIFTTLAIITSAAVLGALAF
ncbi:hypothetical protein DFJ77DRAFT_473207 [Powellomyces hirtus]|nr:hypothetical protein DFJ77DRAFT_473207 [Powellomyces hirtus]